MMYVTCCMVCINNLLNSVELDLYEEKCGLTEENMNKFWLLIYAVRAIGADFCRLLNEPSDFHKIVITDPPKFLKMRLKAGSRKLNHLTFPKSSLCQPVVLDLGTEDEIEFDFKYYSRGDAGNDRIYG